MNHNQYGKAVNLFQNDSSIQFEDLYKDDYCPVPIKELSSDFRFCTDLNSNMLGLVMINSDNEFNFKYLELSFSEGKVISTLRTKNVAQKNSSCMTEWQKEVEISAEDKEELMNFLDSSECYKFKKNSYLHSNRNTGFINCANQNCRLYYPTVNQDLEVNPKVREIIFLLNNLKDRGENSKRELIP